MSSFSRRIMSEDIESVVAVHRAAFPGFLMTHLGPAFLRTYYRTVLDCENSIFLGAFDEDLQLKGFVAGFANPAVFYALLAKRKRRMLRAATLHLAVRPMLWPRVLENTGTTSRRATEVVRGTAELASIAVLPGTQGRGYGTLLIHSFLGAAARLGAQRVELTTDADGNDAVNRLYLKTGFKLDGVLTRSGGRRMNKYNIDIAGSSAVSQRGDV